MKRFFTHLFLALLLVSLPVILMAQDYSKNYGNTPDELLPYRNIKKPNQYYFATPYPYLGPGRDKPAPKVDSVRIGFLGPLEGSVLMAYGKQMLNGAMLAIEEANAKGGYKGLPFNLIVHNDVGLWGAAANTVVRMDDEHVWAFLGSIDDIVTHVALRAALKTEIPMVNTGDPDPTLTETRIPWLVRIIPDDRQSVYQLISYIFHKKGYKNVALIRNNNRYGRVATKELKDCADRVGHPMITEMRFTDGESDFTSRLQVIRNQNPDAVVIWGNPREMGLIVKQMRAMGMKQQIFTSDRAVNPEFLKIAGKDAEGIVTTCQYNPDSKDPRYLEFKGNYEKRFGMEPDVFAAYAYDGMDITIKAIQIAGLNRAKIRDVLLDLKTFQHYHGVTGDIYLDPSWANIRQIYMAEIHQGKFEFYPAVYQVEQ